MVRVLGSLGDGRYLIDAPFGATRSGEVDRDRGGDSSPARAQV